VAFVIAIPELDVVVGTIGVDCAPWARPAVGFCVDAEEVPGVVVAIVVAVAARESSSDAAPEAALNALPGAGDVTGFGEGVEETDVLTVESRAAISFPLPLTLESMLGMS
jgi:hypothetical protein